METRNALQEVAKARSIDGREARQRYWEGFSGAVAATLSPKAISNEANKVRGKQRDVRVVRDPRQAADDLTGTWAHAAGLSSLLQEITREFQGREYEKGVSVSS